MADEPIINTGDKVEVTKEEPLNLRDVINKAVDETNKSTEEVKEVKEEKPEVKEEKKEEKKTQEDLSEEQLNFAKNLYKGLANSDPKIQRATLELLAKQANLEVKDITNKEEVKEAKDALLELIKNGLGEYDFLADKLAPVLREAIKQQIDENLKEDRAERARAKESELQNQIGTAVDKAFNEFTNSLEVKEEVLKLMDEFHPTAKTTHTEYFRTLIMIAAQRKGITLKTEKDKVTEAKVNRNRNDVRTRLASERGSGEIKETVRTRDFGNLREAVAAAVEEVASGKK